jgi:methyl-accepting chemotaxis protein
MSVKKVFTLLFSVMGVVCIGFMATVLMFYNNSMTLKETEERRYLSYLLADELRQSSDDLTRMARVYVVTSDPQYLSIYNDILDIRNGKKVRPISYERIYWDFVAAGETSPRGVDETVSLNELMKRAGFTEEEFALLEEAERNSNELVNLEVMAMDAVEGRISEEAKAIMSPEETNDAFARRIMHDERYHKNKALIMKSLDRFFERLDIRTSEEIDVFARRQNTLFAIIFAAGALMLCSLGVSYIYIRRNVSAPISSLIKGVGRNEDGAYRISRVEVGVSNDIGVLSNALNSVTEQMQIFLDKTGNTAEQLTAASEELNVSADQSAHTAKDVVSALISVSSEISSQMSSVNQSTKMLDSMIADLKNVSENAADVAGNSSKAAGIVSSGVETVRSAISQMRRIETTVNSSAGIVAKLGERSSEIVQIADAISGIAGQTNLLALNAAIEAARAGEHGKGFAVVAEEVRKLAESSHDAAGKIGVLISEIQAETKNAVEAMDEGTTEAKAGANAVDQAGKAFEEIASLVENISESIKSLSGVMENLAAAGTSIADSMAATKEVFETTDKEVGNVSSASQEQLRSMEEIAALTRNLSESAMDLQKGINVFAMDR